MNKVTAEVTEKNTVYFRLVVNHLLPVSGID